MTQVFLLGENYLKYFIIDSEQFMELVYLPSSYIIQMLRYKMLKLIHLSLNSRLRTSVVCYNRVVQLTQNAFISF